MLWLALKLVFLTRPAWTLECYQSTQYWFWHQNTESYEKDRWGNETLCYLCILACLGMFNILYWLQIKIFFIRDVWIHFELISHDLLHIIYLNWFFRVSLQKHQGCKTTFPSLHWIVYHDSKKDSRLASMAVTVKKIYYLAWQKPSTCILIRISEFFWNESECLQRCQKVVIVIVLICFPHFANSWPKGLLR